VTAVFGKDQFHDCLRVDGFATEEVPVAAYPRDRRTWHCRVVIPYLLDSGHWTL
jgi:hypothetical protein